MHQSHINKDKDQSELRHEDFVTFDDASRIYSTTSGFSSEGSSTNSLLSCCNENEECKFNNSIKRYYSLMYQKPTSKSIQDDDDFSKNDDTVTLISSDTCGSNCSCYDSKLPPISHEDQLLDPDSSQLRNHNTIVKFINRQNQLSFEQKMLLEKM